MASVIWRPTSETNGGTSNTTGWSYYDSANSTSVYTSLYAQIDETSPDDETTEIRTLSSGTTPSNGTITFTISGNAVPSNGKITNSTVLVRANHNGNIASGGTLYMQLLDTSSNVLGSYQVDMTTYEADVYTNITFNVSSNVTPKYLKFYVSSLTGTSGSKSSASAGIYITQAYVTINYDLYYKTTLTQTTGGTISISPTGEQKSGTTITITASPNDGYSLNQYLVNGTGTTSRTFSLTSDTTISASWLMNLFFQQGITPKRVKALYKKINNSWEQQTNNISSLFSTDKKYLWGLDTFKKVTSLQNGKEYILLLNYNNNYYYLSAEKFNDYTIKAIAIPEITKINDTLKFSDSPTTFTATASGSGFTLKTGSTYLYGEASQNSTALKLDSSNSTIFTVDTSDMGGFDSDEIITKIDNNAIWLRANINNQNCSLKYESNNTSVGIDYKDRNATYSTGFISFILYEKQ